MVSLLQRLKERKLVQWTLAYAAGAWALLQVFGELRDTFSWPPVIVQVITVVLGIGFFAALVIAWYHGEKGQQHVTGPELLMLSALLVIAGVAVAWVQTDTEIVGSEARGAEVGAAKLASATAGDAEPRSIAVLPFENLSSDPENEYFSDGITEDILTNLSKVGALRVTSRTSVMGYKETTKKLREIAGELGVGYIVEGSVRRAGDQVRISAQLIDARTDKHVWAEVYDRELKDVFAIQSEIAQKIASALHARLSPEEQGRIAAAPTASLGAYDYYLKGRERFYSHQSEADLRASIGLFKQALALDPRYALAYTGLTEAYAELRFYAGPEWQDSAFAAAQKAVALAPDLAEAHVALGEAYAHAGQVAKALGAYRKGVELSPSLVDGVGGMAWAHLERGELDEAARWGKRAIALQPTEGYHYSRVGHAYRLLGDLAEAERYYRTWLQLEGGAQPHRWLMHLHLLRGDEDKAAAEVRAIEAALAGSRAQLLPSAHLALHRGDLNTAKQKYERIVNQWQGHMEGGPPLPLAYVYTKLGETARAEAILREREVWARQKIRREDNPSAYETLTQIYAIRGDKSEALRWLRQAVARGWVDYRQARIDPLLESLRGDREFERILSEMEAKVGSMRQRVERGRTS